MEPHYLLNLLSPRLRDRARAQAFFRFLARRSFDDNLFQAAGALAFTTAFAIVPLSIVVFSVLKALPGFQDWSDQLSHYVFANFVPSTARSVESHLQKFLTGSAGLTVAGVVALVVSLLVTLNGIEATFNRIWRVTSARPKLSRFLVYWTVLTLGSVFATAGIALSARFYDLPLFDTDVGKALETLLLRAVPFLIEVTLFAVIYRVVPHRTVHWRHAFSGAVLASLIFESIKWGMGAYLSRFGNYALLYGALSVVPIFLLWIYFAWLAVLLGASFAASVSAFRYQPVSQRLPHGYEMYGLLRLLARFDQSRRRGLGLHSDDIRHLEPSLTDALVQQMLAQLEGIHVVRRAETGEWLLARDLDELTLAELYEACQLRIPVAEAHLPCRDDAIGECVTAAIDELRIPVRDLLKRRVSTIWNEDT
ncbi:YihY family inner membrane protein [Lysobacter sp. N42]|jgi:membrane protein|uniref:YihY family inner membrane protein n=1 Tax=Lysobacter sp. N42 TaxID=2545719 RepID=UPI001044B819|nr:YihY family inner membrane protein [Lysobacter sp. N42]TCZ83420.1 YihY family inner membrane protein [Lysobacter sp. N42]